MSTCRGCGRAILFARSSTGRAIPLERVRRVYRLEQRGEGPAEARALEELGTVYVSHFETCPKAEQFTRGRERR